MNARATVFPLVVCFGAMIAPAIWAQNTTVAKVRTGAQIREIVLNHKGQNTQKDSDGDGLSDALELQIGTDPNKTDTDEDGTPDGIEILYGSNPLTPGDPPAVFYLVKTLPLPTSYYGGEIMDISNGSYAAGYVYQATGPSAAARWQLNTGSVEAAAVGSFAEAVNDAGVVVGQNGSIGGFRWLPGESLQTIGTANQTFSAWDVNAAGDTVGEAYKLVATDTGAFHLKAGTTAITHLPLVPGYTVGRAMGINDKNEVGGMFFNPGTATVTSAIWSGGTPTLLEILGANNRGSNFVYGIGENGTVIGIKGRKARVWPKTGAAQFLPTDPETANSYPWKMNRAGEIVGEMNGAAVIWRPNGQGGWTRTHINPLILDSNADIATRFRAYSINDKGQIAGSYYSSTDFTDHPVVLTPIPKPSLVVDANRDGLLKLTSEESPDATTAATPYRFWLNDDIDRGHSVDGNDFEQDDISPSEAATNSWVEDWKYNTVQSKRDLEDFTRIAVSTSGLSEAFRNGDLYLGLKWTDTTGTPSIKLYKQYDSGTSYLTSDFQASMQLPEKAILNQRYPNDDRSSMSAHTVVTPGDLFVLPASLIDSLGRSSMLFEGCTAGTGHLKLVILKRDGTNYTEIGEGPGVWLDLKNIKNMYEHWSVGNGSGGVPDAVAGRATSFQYTAQSPEDSKYILFVHGWNMQQWEKERYAETAYKRLWWQGYKGRFGLFSWPTTNRFDPQPPFYKDALTDPTNYDRGEFTAWRAAVPLRQLLHTLHSAYNGQNYVLAHSMGNVVTGEALRLASQQGSGQIVNTYVASQAALPAQCYDGSWPNDMAAVGPHGVGASSLDAYPETANVYPAWLSGNGSAAGTRVNFHNVNDYALWHDAWELNQYTKPDGPDQPDQPRFYVYVDDPAQSPTVNGFGYLKTAQSDPSDRYVYVPEVTRYNWVGVLRLGSASDAQDRYEIMAFAAESRSRAMGASAGLFSASNSVNLQSIWPADAENPLRPYSVHKWHSAQFRSTIMQQQGYWKALLGSNGFNLETTP
jgi:hypothetical protein